MGDTAYLVTYIGLGLDEDAYRVEFEQILDSLDLGPDQVSG